MNSTAENIDCMIGMSRYPDKYFELAIVDPPYGLKINNDPNRQTRERMKSLGYKKKSWDNQKPDWNYFKELFRVSKNQIVYGGGYYEELPITRGWVIWNKQLRGLDFADGEMLWTSFDCNMRIFDYCPTDPSKVLNKIHPTQKPVKLYKWLLDKYAKQGDKILDTHLGSGSSRIACYDYGFDFTGFELDKDYFEAQERRFKDHISQTNLFK